MDFISNREKEIQEMLQTIGAPSIEELFAAVPKEIRHPRPEKEDGMSEFEGISTIEGIGKRNTFPEYTHYLGAGAYDHYVPAIVGAITQQSKFLTAYTPYQPETSQGMLQAIFEYQSVVATLTGMEVSNASVYDGASACAEGVLMAMRASGRTKIFIDQGVHPHYRKVVELYLSGIQAEIVTYTGSETIDSSLLIQSPNFHGEILEIQQLADVVHQAGGYLILCANPMSYGIYASAGELGADIAVGDMQPFGLPLQFGGPYVGYMATKMELVRQLPGRIVGETVDESGKRGYVLTLQAREQHIRREKATSNICTNQALAALANLIALLWWGKEGVRKIALTNFQRASYLREGLGSLVVTKGPIFNEFVVDFGVPKEKVYERFRQEKILPGVSLGEGKFLVAVTEKKTKSDLDRYLSIARSL